MANINLQRAILSSKKLLKKIAEILPIIRSTEDSVLYVQDETGIRLESANRKTWNPIGQPPIIDSNRERKGLDILGATEITKNYDSIVKIYPDSHNITSVETLEFLKQIMKAN